MLNLDGYLEAGSVPAVLHLALRPCHREGKERGGLRLSICSPVNNLLLVGDEPFKMDKPTNQKPQLNFLIGILKSGPRLKIWNTLSKNRTAEFWGTSVLDFLWPWLLA